MVLQGSLKNGLETEGRQPTGTYSLNKTVEEAQKRMWRHPIFPIVDFNWNKMSAICQKCVHRLLPETSLLPSFCVPRVLFPPWFIPWAITVFPRPPPTYISPMEGSCADSPSPTRASAWNAFARWWPTAGGAADTDAAWFEHQHRELRRGNTCSPPPRGPMGGQWVVGTIAPSPAPPRSAGALPRLTVKLGAKFAGQEIRPKPFTIGAKFQAKAEDQLQGGQACV